MRPHLKMLSGNFLTFKKKSDQSGGNPLCRLCLGHQNPPIGYDETLEHLICFCESLSEPRSRILAELQLLCQQTESNINLQSFNSIELTQFVLDPTSLNLKQRINMTDPKLSEFFKISRDFCYIIDKIRSRSLKSTS